MRYMSVQMDFVQVLADVFSKAPETYDMLVNLSRSTKATPPSSPGTRIAPA
jgi:hypothetical protein